MMEKKARFREMLLTADGGRRMVFELSAGVSPEELQSITDKDLRLTVKPWKEKRSRDANAYYWTLTEKLAEAMKLPKPVVHNMNLRDYGKLMMIDGRTVEVEIPDTDEAEKSVLRQETFHLRPTGYVYYREGQAYRVYHLLRGSSTYDTEEMSNLLDGVIEDCKSCGIETATPEEIERMKKLYAENHTKYHAG